METSQSTSSEGEAARQLRQIKIILIAVLAVVVIGGIVGGLIYKHHLDVKRSDNETNCMENALIDGQNNDNGTPYVPLPCH